MYKQDLSTGQKILRELAKGYEKLWLNMRYCVGTGGRGWHCQDPVFIVGCGHSGTTWLLRIMAAHPAFYAVPYESSWARKSDRKGQRLLARFDKLTWVHRRSRWVEKTPKHIHFIKQLLDCRPEARVVVLARNGDDVVASLKSRFGAFDTALERWLADNRAALEFDGHDRVAFFRYEDLVADLEPTLKDVVSFLNAEWDPALLNYEQVPFQFLAELAPQSKEPGSDERVKHLAYRKWQIDQRGYDGRGRGKSELTEEERAQIHREGADVLARFGYSENG